MDRPTLYTEWLILRPFSLDDAPDVRRQAGDRDIASNTLNIPHPYENGMAEEWIGTHQENYERGESATFAIVLRESDDLIGAIGLEINQRHNRAEMGYWIGKLYWNRGYCTEAARAVLAYGFESTGLERIQATHMTRNPTSGRVMQKIGMTHEGTLRRYARKGDVFEDLEMYSILRSEYQ